jgi:16S rRNA (guanine966-N2)-methyltransferase
VTRIVAGSAGGRRLEVPGGRDARGTRPTTDRVREALFAALVSARGGLTGSVVLDLYAGSGALGLEALSRGAAQATLVDSDPRAASTARANAAALGLAAAAVRRAAVATFLAGPAHPVDLVFADPPYAVAAAEVDALLGALADRWLLPAATVVVERSRRDTGPDWPGGFRPWPVRLYGETALWVADWVGDTDVSDDSGDSDSGDTD